MNTRTIPTPAPLDAEAAAALARYDALTRDERQRVARLVTLTGCTLSLAVSAVEATRPQQQTKE
jgi:hypothetical protein